MQRQVNEVKCLGCNFSCQLASRNNIEEAFCGGHPLAIWPDVNHYFTHALHELVLRELASYLPNGVILIDFSIDNILFFIGEGWSERFHSSGLKIILLAEKNMLPMANFWMLRSEFSWSVIEVESHLPNTIKKIKRVLLGRNFHHRRTPTLTEQEMSTLRLLAAGNSSQDIARVMSCDVRRVYRFQYSLCKKFGGLNRLRDLRLMHAIYCTD